jgi:hypothetical protein
MTDYETMRAMITRASARGGMRENGDVVPIEYDELGGAASITVHAGYLGFVTNLNFDKHGNLISIEAYE